MTETPERRDALADAAREVYATYQRQRDQISEQSALLDEAVEVLGEALRLAISASKEFEAMAGAMDVPITAYNHERDKRQAYIDKVDATLAKLRSKT